MTFRRRPCLPLPASLSSATFEFSLMDRYRGSRLISQQNAAGYASKSLSERERRSNAVVARARSRLVERNHSFTLGIIPIA